MALHANLSSSTLVRALSHAGWGQLAGHPLKGARAVLLAIARRGGVVRTTAAQLAEDAGYSERHVRRALTSLEDIGVIRWHRGRRVGGRAWPSLIATQRGVILAMIHGGRPERVAREQAARQRAAKRLAPAVARLRDLTGIGRDAVSAASESVVATARRLGITGRAAAKLARHTGHGDRPTHYVDSGGGLTARREEDAATRPANNAVDTATPPAPGGRQSRVQQLRDARVRRAAEKAHGITSLSDRR